MASRYRLLASYSFALALVAVLWLIFDLRNTALFPAWWVAGLCVCASLLVFQFGIPAPRVGLISMERVPQIGMALTLGPGVAAAISAAASLLWPLINRRYSQGSRTVALLRGVHNAGMTALMILVGGYVYGALEGRMLPSSLTPTDAVALLGMAVAMQAVNILFMTLFFRLDGRQVRSIITPSYALSDLLFFPAGALAAILFNAGVLSTFALFASVMLVLALSFNSIGQSPSEKTDSGPLARIFRARLALRGVRNIDALGERVLGEMHALFRCDEFYWALVDRQRGLLDVRVHERFSVRLPPHCAPMDAGLLGAVIEHREAMLIRDRARVPELLSVRGSSVEGEMNSILFAPMLEDDVVVGLLSVQRAQKDFYSAADLHLLQRLAEEVTAAAADARAFEDAEDYRQRLEQRVTERTADLEQANRDKERLIAALRERSSQLEQEAREDPLTGLANRRYFLARAATECEVAVAVSQPLALAIADLDHFKGINDRLGHRVGDDVLRRSALLMKSVCRPTDLLARIGGEEFALLMPATALADALRVCEDLRTSVAAFDWRSVHVDTHVTVSVGLWQWDGRSTIGELLHDADMRLYQAKRSGRNRVA